MVAYLLFILGVIAQSAVAFICFSGKGALAALFPHIVSVVFCGAGVYLHNVSEANYLGRSRPLFFYSLILIAFFPVVGAMAAIFLFITVKFFGGFRAGIYEEYEEYVSEKHISEHLKQIQTDMAKRIKEEISFESYVDILRWGDIKSKMQVIGKIARAKTKDDVELLRKFMKDPSSEVRFFASGALLKLESAIMGDIASAEKRSRERGSSRDFSDLGDSYLRYINLGLAPRDLMTYYYKKACESYQVSVDLNTEQPWVILNYANALLALKEYVKAGHLLDNAVKLWPDNNDIIFLRGKTFFYMGDAKKVFVEMAEIDMQKLDKTKKEVVEFWTSPMRD